MIDLLLSASSSSDAHIALQIVDRYREVHDKVRVSRFSAALVFNPEQGLVSVSPVLEAEAAPTFEAIPINRPGDNPVVLEGVGPAAAPGGAVLSQEVNLEEPWLLVLRHGDKIRAQPGRIGGSTGPAPEPDCTRASARTLGEALAIEDADLQGEVLGAAMNAMLAYEGHRPCRRRVVVPERFTPPGRGPSCDCSRPVKSTDHAAQTTGPSTLSTRQRSSNTALALG